IEGLSNADYDEAVQPYVAAGDNITGTVSEDAQYYAKNLDAVSDALATFQAG
ncbi:MAG: hypothetical protein K0R68_3931, partial [Mycobacterium sp.]|nr:hypothetical protein [Mycobacterium sp.]